MPFDRAILEEKSAPLHTPCDLDVLLFFHRFPWVLLTGEKIAQYVGYAMKQVGRSLETLIAADLISRAQNPTHDARLYILTRNQAQESLAPVLSAASTQAGRKLLIEILKTRQLAAKTERNKSRRGASGGGGSAISEDREATKWLTKTW